MHCFGMLMDGRAQPTGIRKRGEDATLLLRPQRLHDDVVVHAAARRPTARRWIRLIDTNLPERAKSRSFEIGASTR